MSSWSISRGRSLVPPVVVLLSLAALLTAALAKQAFDSIRSHRRTADRILRDYAEFAAYVYARRAAAELETFALLPALKPLDPVLSTGGESPPEPRALSVQTAPDTILSIDLVRSFFVLPLSSDGSGSRLSVTGHALSPVIETWIADTLATHARSHYGTDWDFATIRGVADGAPHTLVYRLRRDSSGAPFMAAGFEAEASGLDVFLEYSLTFRPLLAPALTAGIARDSMVAVSVTGPPGVTAYRSPWQHVSSASGDDSLGAQFGDLRVLATLDPVAGEAIVLGAPSSSRPILLGGLFVISMSLIAASLLLLRHEQALARLRSDFVASVSHELRTPLAQIRLFAETLLLARVRSPEEERRSVEIIDQEARRLTHLVENVLYVSRSERRTLLLAPAPQDLNALVAAVVESFRPLAQSRGVRIELITSAPLVVPIDRDALRQIILNLLDNAVKYGPEGQTVRVGIALDGEGPAEVRTARIWIEDQGPGIRRSDQERVWKRFVRLPSSTQALPAGTGIGLAVVRELVALHGGRSWVETGAHGGARFVVALPGGAPS